MPDNNIIPDPKEPHHDKSPLDNPDDKDTPGEIPQEVNNPGEDILPEKSKIESISDDLNSKEEISNIEETVSGKSETIPEEVNPSADLPPVNVNNAIEPGNEEVKVDVTEENSYEESESEFIPVLNTGNPPEEEISEPVSRPALISKPKESNYQISLINENLLKVLVTSKKSGVKIDSTVKDNTTSLVTQSNEIYFNPRIDLSLQEVEVLIAIDEDEVIKDTEMIPSDTDPDTIPLDENENTENARSNYQINLINENLLKIKILTGNGVHIDSAARDKKNLFQTQSNKIYLKQKAGRDLQEIEIKIAIEDVPKDLKDDLSGISEDNKIKLIPNPDVVDLIQPPDYSPFMQGDTSYPFEDNTYKNPFDALRHLIRKNVTIGLIVAVILHLAAAGFAYYKFGKRSKEASTEEPSRLIVLQDLPDPKIKLEDVEDPNKPKIEPPVLTEEQEKEMKEPKRELPPRKIVKPPIVTRPKREETKLDSNVEANLNRELDSLRRLREEMLSDTNLASSDSTASDSSAALYEIPDSLKNNFNENDIGLAMYFPKNWKLTDQREINKNEKEFKGVVITDTTAEQPGTMTMFIFLDNENKDYNAEDFKTEFKMLDSNLTAFSKEPKTLAGFTEYRFYIFNKIGTEKLSLRASVRKQFFEQYKNEIEAVVRSIRIKKKEDM